LLHRPARLAFFASGTGSNVLAILTAIREGRLGCTPVGLLSDRPEAGVLATVQALGLPTRVFGRGHWGDRAPRAAAVIQWLRQLEADTLVLAGFLRKVPDELLAAWPGAVLNIHPALLPAFGGAGMYGQAVHRAVWDAGCRVSGATVHLVDGHYDHGPILAQRAVDLEGAQGPEEVARRVLQVEHALYPETLARLARGDIRPRKDLPSHG
jgi:phosphoribosylglycinamide formyltransferase-1